MSSSLVTHHRGLSLCSTPARPLWRRGGKSAACCFHRRQLRVSLLVQCTGTNTFLVFYILVSRVNDFTAMHEYVLSQNYTLHCFCVQIYNLDCHGFFSNRQKKRESCIYRYSFFLFMNNSFNLFSILLCTSYSLMYL